MPENPVANLSSSFLDFFPLPEPREKQTKALEFMDRAVAKGYRDIVIAAPTGIGKTGIGVAACYWGEQSTLKGLPGGYYLCTQKMLQDQLESDLAKYNHGGVSLKSATEYPCPTSRTCAIGLKSKRCPLVREQQCKYRQVKAAFIGSSLAITNYPYFFTEREYVQSLQPRRVLVCDETHTLSTQIIKFVEMAVSETILEELGLRQLTIPEMRTLPEFCKWITEVFIPEASIYLKIVGETAETKGGETECKQAARLEQTITKLQNAVRLATSGETEWVYWSDKDRRGKIEYTARPLDAAPFFKPMIEDAAALRIYMSAYPGTKETFCRSLGLDQEAVAWIGLSSTFPVERRKIVIAGVGSMSRKNVERTMPSFLRVLGKIMDNHAHEKGLIHCFSYVLGDQIAEYLKTTKHANRIIYPKKADQREQAFDEHASRTDPTVILTPSMAEGFDFADDLARWQVIAKIPYPSLGDKQVAAKLEADPEWYSQVTVMTLIQASGRIVRSETDYGVTYITDKDFDTLWNRSKSMFPKWYSAAITRDL